MSYTFTSTNGDTFDVDEYDGVTTKIDIETSEVTGYFVSYEGEPKVQISEKLYEKLKEYYKDKKHRF